MPFQPPPGAPPPGASPRPPPQPPPPPQAQWGQPAHGWYGPPPVTAGSLIERTFKVWWQHVGTLVAFTLAVMVPALVAMGGVMAAGFGLSTGRAGGRPDPAQAFGLFGGAMAVTLLVVLPLGAILLGGISHGVVQWLAGRPAGVGAMFKQGARRIWPLLLTVLLVGLAIMGGYVLLIVPGIMIANATALAFTASAVEGLGAVQAFQRSLELSRGYRWSLFAAFLGVGVLNFLVNMVGALFGLIPILGVVVYLAVVVVAATLPYVLPAVAYHDLRVLKEGVDTTQLARVFE